MSPNSVLIVGQHAERAEALRAVLVSLGQVVIAIATTSRFALQGTINYEPAAVFIDLGFRCELDAAQLATAIHGTFPLRVIAYAAASATVPEALTDLPLVREPFDPAAVGAALHTTPVRRAATGGG